MNEDTLTGLFRGAVGGLLGTVTMTAFRLPIARSLPPTAPFYARYVGGGEPEDHPVAALLLHLAYGVGAGAPFGALLASGPADDYRSQRRSVVAGLAYAALLSVFGDRVVVERVVGQDLAPDERLLFHLGHAVYGLTLGAYVGARRAGD